MRNIALIGSGNLGHHLFNHWINHPQVCITQWVNRKASALTIQGVPCVTSINDIQPTDAYVLAVPDRKIATLSAQLPPTGMAIHCSGSIPLDHLKNKGEKAVLYLLQTFSKGRSVTFNTLPLFLETQSVAQQKGLQQLADTLSDKQHWMTSTQRLRLHLAAVFANNFTNHLYHIAGKVCQENELPFDVLFPLIQETAAKALELSPKKAQTGPALRNDNEVIGKHLELIEDAELKKIYTILTQSIQSEK